MPKLNALRENAFPVSEEYKKQTIRRHMGLGDQRHAKLGHGEKIIIIGNLMEDEISGKKIDVFYGIRECDLDMYLNDVVRTINEGYSLDTRPNLSNGKYSDFYTKNYAIPKSMNMERYYGNPSEFESELREDYKYYFEQEGPLLELSYEEHSFYHHLYDNYADRESFERK
jgi:hypothetical protein